MSYKLMDFQWKCRDGYGIEWKEGWEIMHGVATLQSQRKN